jgi:hypothetical protein
LASSSFRFASLTGDGFASMLIFALLTDAFSRIVVLNI